ncbi:hypothetical protein [Mesorhizobium sp.]|uniref:hypothetical protein n=1 Tax=Mesorhizobium sp. TaxID=1871066 RepID=UPI002579BD29|nr:hypothetical protein [Mesorhizobium sp.]
MSAGVSQEPAFIVGHVDYVRTVPLVPLGSEQTELTAEWLFSPEALADPTADIDNIVAFDTGMCWRKTLISARSTRKACARCATRPAC